MPSETIYLNREQWATVDNLVEDAPGVSNRRQAIQYLVNNCAQQEVVQNE